MNEAVAGGDDLPALTGLRFVAAFYVFLFHIQIRAPITEQPFLASLLGQGAVGMTLFFMLSGFILTHRYAGKAFSDRNFIVARFSRIYPVYVASFILALPMLYFQMGQLRFGIISAIFQIIIIVITALAMIQAWIPMLFSYVNNNASWSLSVEAFFYGMFVLLLERLSALGARSLMWIAVVLYVFSMLGPISYYVFEDRPSHGLQIFYAMPIFRLPEFILGIVAYLAMQAIPLVRRHAGSAALALLILAILYLGAVGGKLPIFVGHNWVMIPLVAAVLISLSSGGRGIFGKKYFVYLGKISYAFYCFQFHAIYIVMYAMPGFRGRGWEFMSVSLILLVVISALCFHFYEEPSRKFLRKRYAVA